MPKPKYDKSYLKHLIYTYDFDSYDYSELSDKSMNRYFRFADIIDVIKETMSF